MWRGVPVLLLCALASNSPAETKTDWEAIQYLAGEWTGEGAGNPGVGSGGFSFTPELQGQILVRKNWAEYPATKDRPAFRHDDLMILYREPADKRVRAEYFDNEGHMIRYAVQVSADRNQIILVSDREASAPRYRFTYSKNGTSALKIKFEIAPAGKPDQFSTYIEAAARRK